MKSSKVYARLARFRASEQRLRKMEHALALATVERIRGDIQQREHVAQQAQSGAVQAMLQQDAAGRICSEFQALAAVSQIPRLEKDQDIAARYTAQAQQRWMTARIRAEQTELLREALIKQEEIVAERKQQAESDDRFALRRHWSRLNEDPSVSHEALMTR